MFEIAIDDSIFRDHSWAAAATDQQVDAARASALRKMKNRFETAIKREASKQLRIPQRALADRLFSNDIGPGDEELKIWFGTWPVSPFSLGGVSVYGMPGKSGGVRAGKRTYPGAFLGTLYSGTTKVWIRLHSKHYSPELYPTKYRPGDRGLGELKGRFPVVRAAVPIDAVIQSILEREGDSIAAEFGKVFVQELNYYVNVKGRA